MLHPASACCIEAASTTARDFVGHAKWDSEDETIWTAS